VASEIEKATPDLETGIVNSRSVETNKTLAGEMSVKGVVNQKQSVLLMLLQAVVGVVEEDSEVTVRAVEVVVLGVVGSTEEEDHSLVAMQNHKIRKRPSIMMIRCFLCL